MAEQREREEYYEAMPGTMTGPQVRRERELTGDPDAPSRSNLGLWLTVAALVLLGLLFLAMQGANRGAKTNGTNAANGTNNTMQNNTGNQPAGGGTKPSY